MKINEALLRCVFCDMPAEAHGEPGRNDFGHMAEWKDSRLCPGKTSQFFSPRIGIYLRAIEYHRGRAAKHLKEVDIALAQIAAFVLNETSAPLITTTEEPHAAP